MQTPAQLAVSMSVHDVKNALLVVQLVADRLARCCRDCPPGQHAELQMAIQRAFELTMEALVPRSPPQGDVPEARAAEGCDVGAWLAAARDVHAHLFEPSATLVVEDVAPGLLAAAPIALLDRVLLNLLLNARDVLPPGGRVALRAQAGARTVVISVNDSGPGIPPQRLAQLFQPFSSSKSGARNAGLGLYAIREELHRIGGTVTVRSPAGEGATFTIALPAL